MVTARRGCKPLSQKGSSRFLRNSYVAEVSTLKKFVTLVCLHVSVTNRMIIMLSQGNVQEMNTYCAHFRKCHLN